MWTFAVCGRQAYKKKTTTRLYLRKKIKGVKGENKNDSLDDVAGYELESESWISFISFDETLSISHFLRSMFYLSP